MVAAVAAALFGGGQVLWATRRGPGLSPDSLGYVLLARSLASGEGFRLLGQPISHFPPGYPALLALAGAVGLESLDRARIVHAALFTLNGILLALVTRRAAREMRWAAPLATFLFVASPKMMSVHAMAWSEPAFVALSLGATLLLSARLAGGGRGSVVGAAFCLALALLVRYAGVALVPAMLLGILLWERFPRPRRFADATLVALLGLAPLAAWLARNALLAGSATDRALAYHPFGAGSVEQLVGTAAELWGLGPRRAWAIAGLLPVAGLLLAGSRLVSAIARRSWGCDEAPAESATRGLAALMSVSHAATLAASVSLMDVDTPLNARILTPIHVFGIVLVASLAAQLKGWPARVTLVGLAALATLNVGRSLAEARSMANTGWGYSTRYWRDSPTLAFARSLPPGTLAYSNDPEALAFFTACEARDVPSRASRTSMLPRPSFAQELKAMCSDVSGGRAILVYLGGVSWRWQVPTAEELEAACGLAASARFEDGAVYGVRAGG